MHRAPEARRGVVLDPRSGIMPVDRSTMVDYPYAWAGIYRRDLGPLLHFPGNLHSAEDRPWIWRLHREAGSYAVVSLAGLFYRRLVATSLTQIGDARQLQFLDAFALVLEQVRDDAAVAPKAVRSSWRCSPTNLGKKDRIGTQATRVLIERSRAMLRELPVDAVLAADSRRRACRRPAAGAADPAATSAFPHVVTVVFYSSTLFGRDDARRGAGRRAVRAARAPTIVDHLHNATVPEIAGRMDEATRVRHRPRSLRRRRALNDVVAPVHPAHWSPRPADVPLLSRLVCAQLGIADPDDVSELVVESPAVAPAQTIATLIRDCPITVYSDGLMSYGPPAMRYPRDVAGRIDRLLYLDLVPSLQPLLLRDHGVPALAVPLTAFEAVVDRFPVPAGAAAATGCPLIIGQYLAALGIITPAEESALHEQMVRALAARRASSSGRQTHTRWPGAPRSGSYAPPRSTPVSNSSWWTMRFPPRSGCGTPARNWWCPASPPRC